MTRGAGKENIIQMVSSNASLSPAQIADARVNPSQPLFFQLYKHKHPESAKQRVREMFVISRLLEISSHLDGSETLGYNAIFLTVDAPVSGNRERDVRAPFELEDQEREVAMNAATKEGAAEKSAGEMPKAPDDLEKLEGDDKEVGGTAAALFKNDDVDMTWDKVRSSFENYN